MGEEEEKQDVDKGYAWVILAGCFTMYLLVVGSVKSYGILYTEIDEYFSVGSGPLAFIGSVIFMCMMGLGPFANYLAVKTSFRKLAFAGGLLLGLGYAASCLVNRMEYLFITFGATAGLGYGMAFAPCSTIISYYFEKRRGLANGLTVSASGIGAILFPFIYSSHLCTQQDSITLQKKQNAATGIVTDLTRLLIEEFSLKPALLIIGSMLFNVCVAACLFRQPAILVQLKKLEQKKQKGKVDTMLLNGDTVQSNQDDNDSKKGCSWGPDFKFSLFKRPRFTLYAIAFMISMNGYGNNLILIPSHTRMMGYDKSSVALTVSVMGGCEVAARIFFGWVADKEWIQRRHIFMISFFLGSIFAFITPQFQSLEYMCAYAAIIGIFPGSFWSLLSVLLIDVVGMKDFPSAFGLISLCLAVGAAISQPCIALLKDKTGDWNASFYLTGALLLIPSLMILAEPLVIRCEKKLYPPSDDIDDVDAVPLRRQSSKSTPKPTPNDTDSLLEDDPDISFTSHRISQIYKPYRRENSQPESPRRTSAPLATGDV